MERQDFSWLVAATERGDREAADALFAALYAELHRLASRQLSRSGGGSLGTTTLLHEAYLDISRRDGAAFPDRARFLGYAAHVMRGVMIDHARVRYAQKRGGAKRDLPLPDQLPDPASGDADLTALGEALDRLAAVDAELAQIVDLKFFCGFSLIEIAAMRGQSERTVQRHWEKARTLLHELLSA